MALQFLLSRGWFDQCLDNNRKHFHLKQEIMSRRGTWDDKIVMYRELPTENGVLKFHSNGFDYFDFVDTVDLVYEGTIHSIKCYIGGQLCDSFESEDLVTQIDTLCSFYSNRRVKTIGTKTVVPLEMFPFHKHNLVSELFCDKQDIRIVVNDSDTNYKLYGNAYNCDSHLRSVLHDKKEIFNCGIQSIAKTFDVTPGANECQLPSGLYHLLYFWGPKIDNVKLMLDKPTALFDVPSELLENLKLSLGYTCKPYVVFFSQDKLEDCGQGFTLPLNPCSINNARLILETTETAKLHMVMLKIQCMQTKNGMSSLLML